MTEMREAGKDYFVEWQHATRKLSEARKKIAALTASGMGGAAVPIKAREIFRATTAFVTAAIAHYRRCLEEELNKESHRATVLRGEIESAQRYLQMFKWFADEEEERR